MVGRKIWQRGFALVWLVLAGAIVALSAGEGTPPPTPKVEAWATLWQMMDRLRTSIGEGDLSQIHNEDPVSAAAVSHLLEQADKTESTKASANTIAWTVLLRDISALHTAADADQKEACTELLQRIDQEFQKLVGEADPSVLRAARAYADRHTCPMHSEVVGAKDALCRKCGMPLDQLVVLLPSDAGSALVTRQAVKATITTNAPLAVGQPAQAVLHLRRATGEPVTLADLIETHTRKIHLLVVDPSLTDYHHEHPQPTGTPGDYAFAFTPQKPGSYLAWADLRPLPLGLQEYEKASIAGTGNPEPLRDKEPRLEGEADGLHFQLILPRAEVKSGVATAARLRITQKDGSGFAELEPVMAAFAHLVGFHEDRQTILHMHPTGAPITEENARGGPELEFKIYATKPGFIRLFAQVQIGGRQVFVPFGLRVLP